MSEWVRSVPPDSNGRRGAILQWSPVVVPGVFLEGLRLAAGAPFSWSGFAIRWALVAGLLLAARWTQPYPVGGTLYVWPSPGVIAAGVAVGAALIYAVSGTTWAAWIVLGALYLLLLGLDTVLVSGRGILWRWGVHGLLALAGGLIPVSIAQIESHFADEEFFVALQALAFGLFWALLLAARGLLARQEPTSARRGLRFDRRWSTLVLILAALAGLGVTMCAYQRSFYPPQAPVYEGISSEAPFLYGEVSPDPQTFDGAEVFRRLLAQVEANPRKGPPEYGMLALGTGEQHWTQAFRESLLSEATKGRFTGPAHSVKSVQYEAALRAYYLPRVYTAFPDLFSDDDLALLQRWFAAINRRALTVEWVDWMYALAFAKWPEGPYENQENGAGLLALLESKELAAPDLSLTNRDYLERNQRGWLARFRNTDDAFIYQAQWINNAYFQSFYTGEAPEDNVRLSFEWLLLQALPDGAPLRYNHPGRPSLAGTAYLGAHLLGDPRYIWLAGRALTDAETRGQYLFAQPGVEEPIYLTGHSPTQGSCLLYGDSGLPNQAGPLAPDKIVFRDGWLPDSAYLLLNLRFTGWHRYKATNTITLVYQDGPLTADALDGEPIIWLPVGRSAFRDKRVPRKHLNGLLIPCTGMSRVVWVLTGLGSPWAQDPPPYARVERFISLPGVDMSRTIIDDWHGWTHARTVYFVHRGPILVIDHVRGPRGGGRAAIVWHLMAEGERAPEGWWLRREPTPWRVVLSPTTGETTEMQRLPPTGVALRSPDWQLMFTSPHPRRLDLTTAFLGGAWAGTEYEAELVRDEAIGSLLGQYIRISGQEGELELIYNESERPMTAHGLRTDGQALLTLKSKAEQSIYVYFFGGMEAGLPVPGMPTRVVDGEGRELLRGVVWDVVDGEFRVWPQVPSEVGVVVLSFE